jgi:hypothetical protein
MKNTERIFIFTEHKPTENELVDKMCLYYNKFGKLKLVNALCIHIRIKS